MAESWFTPEKIKSMQPYIDKTVNDLLDRMKSRGCASGPVDLVEEFALPVPSYVRCLAEFLCVGRPKADSGLDHLYHPRRPL
jgi:cytochrome P450